MPNGTDDTKEMVPASPYKAPRITMPTVDDAAQMDRAMKGVTTGRAKGLATQAAAKAPGGSIFSPDKSKNYSIRDKAPFDK